ncbi:hypothetical protein [Falsirhodobacter sp. 1013]|uniref:hypothetical protein n=1 Tax=Falsirhodobacter sp. 1013 TaxID=3417566 RepID=UPI003EBF4FCC
MNEDIVIPPMRDDGLQLEEHRRLQRRFWTFQRVAWSVFGFVCVIALLGFTGSGGVFQKQTVRFDNAVVEVPRVTRWEASDDLSIRFAGMEVPPEIILSQPFFDLFSIERIQPEPRETVLMSSAQRLRFATEGAPPHEVSIGMRSVHFGWARFDMTIGGETRMVNILVLP